MWYVRPAKAQTSLRIRAIWSEPLLVASLLHDCQAHDLTAFEFLSLTGGCKGSSESIHINMTHCWKSYVAAHVLQILHKAAFRLGL